MRGNWLLFAAAALPMLLSPLAYGLGRKKSRNAIFVLIAVCGGVLALLLGLLRSAAQGAPASFAWDGFCGLGLRMRADGFRALYACVAGFMWLVTSVFSLDYFKHEENVGRYALFTLITFGATVGLFLSDTLYSTFLFFEVMSMASYPWVAHEEEPAAMRAAQTYLYIAVIGGLVTLMGLFLLPAGLAVTGYGALAEAAGAVGPEALWLPALLTLFGFGAKAGSFPLHIWLPKAHPVAPAPASALLSGILTKAGVFGMLALTCLVMKGYFPWGDLMFRLGVVTMFLGAALAILSGNLKRTLACSSLSQIGFIMIGVGLCGMLDGENGLAAYGAVGHMVNHSLFKLTLFLCAGVVAMNTHRLALKDVQGYGRGKPLLQIPFLLGALGISGVPLFSGYLSKSLLHEGILELIAHLEAHGENAGLYRASEIVFLVSGGMTLCYMLKLYVCLFVKKNPARQAEYDQQKKYLSPAPALALLCAALWIPAIGLFPGVLMSGFGGLSQSFLGAAAPALPIAYFSGENLLGAAKSIAIGLGLFGLLTLWERFLVKRPALAADLEAMPRFDLENAVYRPALWLLTTLGYGFSYLCDKLMDWLTVALKAVGGLLAQLLDRLTDWLTAALKAVGGLLARCADALMDSLALLVRRAVLPPRKPSRPAPVGNRFTWACGKAADGVAAFWHRLWRKKGAPKGSYAVSFAAAGEEAARQSRRLARSISFGLLMFALGLLATLAYLLC